jgi:hypothetical protein
MRLKNTLFEFSKNHPNRLGEHLAIRIRAYLRDKT